MHEVYLVLMPDIQSHSYLECHILYCKWWMTIRNVWSICKLPTPLLVDDMYTAWLTAMELAAEASRDMLQHCLDTNWRLGSWPSAIGNAIVLCFGALSTARINLSHNGIPLPPALDIDLTLDQIQALIRVSSDDLAGLLDQTNAKLKDYGTQLETARFLSSLQLQPSTDLSDLPTYGLLNGDQNGLGNTGLNEVFSWGLESWWNFGPVGDDGVAWSAGPGQITGDRQG
jgi:hypothetical protein